MQEREQLMTLEPYNGYGIENTYVISWNSMPTHGGQPGQVVSCSSSPLCEQALAVKNGVKLDPIENGVKLAPP